MELTSDSPEVKSDITSSSSSSTQQFQPSEPTLTDIPQPVENITENTEQNTENNNNLNETTAIESKPTNDTSTSEINNNISPPNEESNSTKDNSINADNNISTNEIAQDIVVSDSEESSDVNQVPFVGATDSFSSRLLQFHHSLNLEKIPLPLIQQFVFDYGTPDSVGLRSLLWKLVLNYLPPVHSEWEHTLKTQRSVYEQFVQELTVNPYAKLYGSDKKMNDNDTNTTSPTNSNNNKLNTNKVTMKKISSFEDPLSSQSTEWSQFYKDEDIRREIQKDVARTYSSFHFFNERVRPIETTPDEVKKLDKEIKKKQEEQEQKRKKANLFDNITNKYLEVRPLYISPQPKRSEDETHHDVIKRILFIYAKLNPGIKYVQGMNEILAPLYYVFAHDSSSLFQHFAEADAFFCFTQIMSEIRDRFIKSLDSAPTGILAVVASLNDLLKDCDYDLWKHLEEIGVDPRFYSFRWLTLLLSQEFELPEVLRLWDSFFADDNRFEFLLYFCCAMIVCVKDQLIVGDFAEVLRILQHYGENGLNFQQVLTKASELKRGRENKNKVEEPAFVVVTAPTPVTNSNNNNNNNNNTSPRSSSPISTSSSSSNLNQSNTLNPVQQQSTVNRPSVSSNNTSSNSNNNHPGLQTSNSSNQLKSTDKSTNKEKEARGSTTLLNQIGNFFNSIKNKQ